MPTSSILLQDKSSIACDTDIVFGVLPTTIEYMVDAHYQAEK